ncbi:MAG: class I SAM-dependent methyltransferase [Desulfovibrio sp.]|jgi:SAM-dependent methyltransferase|nr:class I SAM-dependent methyltransferase [Desulfovibrio sp.]
MPVFADYARYYNLLYRDKDYAGEAVFVLETLNGLGIAPGALLDIGCGTGRHALEMTRRGVRVTGVDVSKTMLAMGEKNIAALNSSDFPCPLPVLRQGDARNIRLRQQVDAVTSLFHVMSYQNSEDDALSVLRTAREHLAPGGLFFFDFWHGPGVLRDLPERRERTMEDADTRLRRLAVPEHHVGDNVVVVNYTVDITDIAQKRTAGIRESHSMRYWFLPELRYLARQAGFSVAGEGGWMRREPPGLSDWNAWMVLRA